MNKPKWLIFLIVGIIQFMVVLDAAITNVALPAIKQSLHFNNSSLQWVLTAYALAFGGFLMLGGRTADLFGRRRVLMGGLAAFTLFSLLIGLSTTPLQAISLRALQGMSAAFMSPAALSIVLATFTEGKARNKALSYWGVISTGGAATGLLLGGILTDFFNWRWNFFINVPIGLALLAVIPRIVPAHAKESANKQLDLPGAVLVTAGLMSLVYAISQAPHWGWTALSTLSVTGLSLALIAAFIINEKKAKHPLVPLSIFKIRNVTGGNLIMAPLYAALLSTFFIASLYAQNILGYSPLKSGLSFLPFPVILGIVATQTPRLVARYGFKRFTIIGPIVAAIGLALLARIPVGGDYFTNILPSFLIIPAGIGLTMMPVFASATSGVPTQEAGLASGLVSTAQQMGGALGLAIISGIAASVAAASANLGHAGSLVHGFDRAILVASGFMLIAAALGAFIIKQPGKRPPQAKQVEERDEHVLKNFKIKHADR